MSETTSKTEAGEVEVVALVWEIEKADPSIGEPREHTGFWFGGYYSIGKSGRIWDVGTFTGRGASRHVGYFGTLAEAKAAAQTDLNKRFRESLPAHHANADVERLTHERDELLNELGVALDREQAFKETVERIWKVLGSPTYKTLGGKNISQVVADYVARATTAERALETANAREAALEEALRVARPVISEHASRRNDGMGCIGRLAVIDAVLAKSVSG